MKFGWETGRQNNTYRKFIFLLFQRFDLYYIKFEEHSYVWKHKDPVKSGKHFRLNIHLNEPKSGGKFISDKTIINTKYLKFFRPDINYHQLTEIKSGSLKIISIGFII